jgi:microsomal dipeptidase-like Zn-dependent dipeptidase
MLALAEALVKKGYKDQDVRGIIGENFLRVFRAACG